MAGRPRGRAKSLAAITGTDLRKFAARQFTRERMLIAVVGDIGPADLARLLDRSFGDLPAHGAAPALSEAPPPGPGGIAVMGRDLDQSVVLFGEAGIKRSDPDFYAAALLDDIVGGGDFSSRLTRELRIKRGLVYGIETGLVTLDHAHCSPAVSATKNASAREAIELTRAEWKRMGEAGPTRSRTRRCQDPSDRLVSAALRQHAEAANVLLGIQLAGLPIDYVDKRAGYPRR